MNILKNIFYIIMPVVAFLLILTNALYGNLLFESRSEQVANKYSIYIHLQPEWESSNKNILFDVTTSWFKEQNSDMKQNDTYNENQLQIINGKPFVELKHSFSNCDDKWQPILYRKAIDAVRHELEYVQGLQLSADPNISIYPDVDGKTSTAKNFYVQFIPICTQEKTTSYDYSIKTDNDEIGFDVYFVPSDISESFYDDEFIYNQNQGCFAENKQSFSGSCSNIPNGGGLLVVIPDNLEPWLTKIIVNLYEKNNSKT